MLVLLHHVYILMWPVQISCNNNDNLPGLTGTACSTLGVQLYSAVPVPAADVQLPPHRAVLVRRGRWDDNVLDFQSSETC